MKPISTYCNTNPGEGWDRLPVELLFAPKEEEGFSIGFTKDGLQMMATVQDGRAAFIGWEPWWVHVSIGLLPSMAPKMTRKELIAYQQKEAPYILRLFFEGYSVKSLPADPRMPDMLHFAIGQPK